MQAPSRNQPHQARLNTFVKKIFYPEVVSMQQPHHSLKSPAPSPSPHHADERLLHAQRVLAPILTRARHKDRDTLIFLALTELQRQFPGLRPHELDGLLQKVLKSTKTMRP
jgi:hypothetical protein